MAKVNIVDQVQAMENEDKVKELISKQVRLPATIVGGKKRNGEETIQYRCAYCGHTWNRYYKNQYILTFVYSTHSYILELRAPTQHYS